MKKCIKSCFTFLVAISILFGECMLPLNAKASNNTTTEVQSEISKEVVGNQTDSPEITNNNDTNQDTDTANDVDSADGTEVVEEPDAVEKPDEIPEQEETASAGEQKIETQAEEKVQITGLCWQNKGGSIDVGAAYTASADSVEFKWQAYNLTTQKWSVISDWSTGNWSTWHPESAGGYWLHVEARTGGGAVSEYTICFQVPGVQLSVSGICWVNHGSSIDFGAGYQTNDSNVQFQWQLYDIAKNEWSLISDWSSGNWTSWKPSKGGSYLIYVTAKNGWGQTVNYAIGYSLPSVELTSFSFDSVNGNLGIGESTTLRASYTNPYQQAITIQFIYYDGKNWKGIAKDTTTCKWQPSEKGSYLVGCQLFDENGVLITQQIQGCVVKDLYCNLTGIGVLYQGNRQVYACAGIDTNDYQVQYRWQYYDPTTKNWTTILDWSHSIGVTFTVPHTGYYWIHVEAKLSNGKTEAYTIGYTVPLTPEELANALAKQKVEQLGGSLVACYNWSTYFPFEDISAEWPSGYTPSQWFGIYGFEHGFGHCYVKAATFYYMAKQLGYEAHMVMGYVPTSSGIETHGWVELVINGSIYVCDPSFEQGVGKNGYMITYGASGTWRYMDYHRVN